jgi:hypothetical protein
MQGLIMSKTIYCIEIVRQTIKGCYDLCTFKLQRFDSDKFVVIRVMLIYNMTK